MPALRVVLGDQLTDGLAALRGAETGDLVLMAEVGAEAAYVPHHRQKLVMVFAAMRRFAERLRRLGLEVRYVRLDDADNTAGSTMRSSEPWPAGRSTAWW